MIKMLDWVCTFRTNDRRELGDYAHTLEVKADNHIMAIKNAVKELPLGENDNPYSKLGVEWELIECYLDVPEIGNYYTNDKIEV